MLTMSQINHIRDLRQSGYRISEIERITGTDHKTISKYLAEDDFSPSLPVAESRASKLDAFKPIIDEWLTEDKKHWYKQRHTAKRVYDRLVSEKDYTGSYNLVQRYVKEKRDEQRSQRANQELIWEPGTAQCDFGEADFYERGIMKRKKYLVLSFPYSNDGFVQVFGGETAECVCQGLQDIFRFIGGVPPTVVFDNATGIGRRICDQIHESALFSRFRAHLHFSARFCNPRSGWEKGNVERKVGYDRSNLFVPVPSYTDIVAYNRCLLPSHEIKASEEHYKKGKKISRLFQSDLEALIPFQEIRPFHVVRYESLRADGYGKVCIDGKHFYSTCPEFSGKRNVLVGIGAHYVDIYTDSGDILVRHLREFGETRTDSTDYSTTVSMLLHRPGAWENSGVRQTVSDPLREYMDKAGKVERKNCLSIMTDLTERYGFLPAVKAMDMALRDGRISSSDAEIIAARITGYGIDTPPSDGPSLEEYDRSFLPSVKGGTAS